MRGSRGLRTNDNEAVRKEDDSDAAVQLGLGRDVAEADGGNRCANKIKDVDPGHVLYPGENQPYSHVEGDKPETRVEDVPRGVHP